MIVHVGYKFSPVAQPIAFRMIMIIIAPSQTIQTQLPVNGVVNR